MMPSWANLYDVEYNEVKKKPIKPPMLQGQQPAGMPGLNANWNARLRCRAGLPNLNAEPGFQTRMPIEMPG